MTAASIGAGDAGSYSEYLESRTVAPSRGDYYLSADGEPTEAQGVWRMSAETLGRLGLRGGEPVRAGQLVALMEGRRPGSGEFIRQAGADGSRAGGIDLTFSAPKSVSVVWALGSVEQRAGVEAAHAEAVARALEYVRDRVPVVREGAGGQRLGTAKDLLAAEFRHTTARGVDGGVPDPQLHSHVVVSGVVREDGRFAAVGSRSLFRSAREVGAFYRTQLAEQLRGQGYTILAGTGKDGRYFEIAGVSQGVRDECSGRSREVWLAAERFRAKYGRAPARDELRNVKLENRRAKTPQTRPELDAAWQDRAAKHGLDRRGVRRLQAGRPGAVRREDGEGFTGRVLGALSSDRAMFNASELRATVLEQGLGQRDPGRVDGDVGELVESGGVVELQDGRFTTGVVRRTEQAALGRIERMGGDRTAGVGVGERARQDAIGQVAERIGAALSAEQQGAVSVLTGDRRAAVLVGQAGTGKGVVLDAAARAEQIEGRRTFGVAVSGSTAERLGRDSPALAGSTMTLDSLVARANSGRLKVDEGTTVFLDEAAMSDTRRLDALTGVVERGGGKLVMAGDGRQLSSIGPGGIFDHISDRVPRAMLSEVRRTQDVAERQAWADLRAGRAEHALAHYQQRGALHFSQTRDEAVEAAVQQWRDLAEVHGAERVALIADASNVEIDRLNARAQHLLGQADKLGEQELALPDRAYGLREGDRVAFTAQHRIKGQSRVENGTRGQVTHLDMQNAEVTLTVDGSGRQVTLGQDDLGVLRLGYAQHVYRQQGATVERAVVVTGGWQTDRESAYVQASRARNGTDWHLSREDLGTEGVDVERVGRLAEKMRASHAQTPSITIPAVQRESIAAELERSTRAHLEAERQRQAHRQLAAGL